MHMTKEPPQFDKHAECADLLALCAGRVHWLAVALMDNADVAKAMTKQWVDFLMTFNRTFDGWLARWACKMTIKACIEKKHCELAADQHDPSVWNHAIDDLRLDREDRMHNLSLECIQRSVRALPLLPRFMFVLHVLENYTIKEVATMLRLNKNTCDAALAYALAAMTKSIHASEGSLCSKSRSMHSHQKVNQCEEVCSNVP